MLAFCTAWLWYFRREYVFPRALVILPGAVLLIFLLNAVRIAALVLIGDAGICEDCVRRVPFPSRVDCIQPGGFWCRIRRQAQRLAESHRVDRRRSLRMRPRPIWCRCWRSWRPAWWRMHCRQDSTYCIRFACCARWPYCGLSPWLWACDWDSAGAAWRPARPSLRYGRHSRTLSARRRPSRTTWPSCPRRCKRLGLFVARRRRSSPSRSPKNWRIGAI